MAARNFNLTQKFRIRKPAVAGQFYSGTLQGLKNQIEPLVNKKSERADAIACMLPHAGYMYSGRVAGETVSRINIKDKIVLIGPNHTGYGVPFSIMSEGAWQNPLGEIKIDTGLAKQILKNSKNLKEDMLAHLYEHSLEVELPFLQYFKTDFEIVPIVVGSDQIAMLKEVGRAIAKAIEDTNIKSSTLIIASSDMTHYEPYEEAQKKDNEAIRAILELNEDKLMDKVTQLGISMCGYAPAIIMITAAKVLGAKKAELVKYMTSGDVTGDKASVVGYAGIVVY